MAILEVDEAYVQGDVPSSRALLQSAHDEQYVVYQARWAKPHCSSGSIRPAPNELLRLNVTVFIKTLPERETSDIPRSLLRSEGSFLLSIFERH